ncbi:NYN domain-containing protein [Mycena sanguinolenta]|nr:NYN domain-containing protein [Mycena sanguinolenta]
MQSSDIQPSDVAIFWDYENCHASSQISGYEIVSGIRNVAHRFGPVKYFKAYMEVPDPDTFRSLSLRSELQSSGVSLTDCPHNGRKNVADQMIMVDMLAYAMDHPAPATLILISGDRDFAYAVSILRLRRYDVVVISLPLPGAHISLKSQASVYLDWNAEVLGYTSSQPEGRADSPSAVRNPFNSQSPGAHRTSHLPTPGTPFIKDVKLPPKHDATAVSGLNRSASYFEDPFSPKVTSPQVVAPSVPTPASAPEPPFKAPGLRERPEVVAGRTYAGKPSQEPEENNVETVTTLVQSAYTPSFRQVLENNGDVNATPSQSTLTAAPPVCSSAAVEVPQPTPPPEPCSPPVTFAGCATAAGSAIDVTIPPGRNTNDEARSLELVPPIYQTLVDALRQCRTKGIDRPSRSVIAVDIVAKDKKVFERAGVKKFREFTALAEKDKIITLGGTQASAWISLHPDWHSSVCIML